MNHQQLGTGEEIADIPCHSANGVVTYIVLKGTTADGAEIELPAVIVLLFDGFRLLRMEVFDFDQCDQALASFDELDS